MEVLKEFLESSTIHGMSYISHSKKFIRYIWILTVLTGFISAGFLIMQSFHNWEMSPISTTITTNPIEQVTYPEIFVCPPRNTFTNLNHDLVNVPDERIDQDYIYELIRLVDKKVQEAELEKSLIELDTFDEKDKFKKWYLGLTEFALPQYYYIFGYLKQIIEYKTTATSGTISSPFFRSKYDKKNFYFITVYIFDLSNLLLHIEEDTILNLNLEIDTKETEGGSETFSLDLGSEIDSYKLTGPMTKTLSFNRSDQMTQFWLTFERDFHYEHVENWSTKRMTGMKIEWYFSNKQGRKKEIKSYTKYSNQSNNMQFSKFVNALHSSSKRSNVQEAIKRVRMDIVTDTLKKPAKCHPSSKVLLEDDKIKNVLDEVLNLTGQSINGQDKYDLTNENLDEYAKQFFYLSNCPDTNLVVLSTFLKQLFQDFSKPMIIATLGKLNAELSKRNLSSEKKVISFFMESVTKHLNLEHPHLAAMNTGYSTFDQTERKVDKIKNTFVQSITTHPVHILNKTGSFNPSALIPFCDLNGNMEVVGTHHSKFPIPVCSAFVKVTLNNQVCYKIDVNEFLKEVAVNGQQNVGLNLFLDYNEDKQYIDQKVGLLVNSSLSMSRNLIKSKNKGNINEAMIYFSTLAPIEMYGGGNYKLSAVKEIKGTDVFLNMNDDKKGCQNKETLEECTTMQGVKKIIDQCGCIPYKLANFSHPYESPVCKQNEVSCTDKVSVSVSECKVPCEGTYFDVWKEESTDIDENTDSMKDIFKAYDSFKNLFHQEITYPIGILEYKFRTKLKHVRIYFDTPTFDIITKDEKAKWQDILSAIGGTMGLLTGFSIISAVEILYFAVKLLCIRFYNREKNQ